MADSSKVYFGTADARRDQKILGMYLFLRSEFPPKIVDSLFKEAHLTSLSDDKKEAILEKFMSVFEKRMAVRTWNLIQPAVREKIMNLSQKNKLHAQQEIMKQIPNLPQLYKQEALALRKEFITVLGV